MAELGPITIEGDAVARTVQFDDATARWRYVNGDEAVHVEVEVDGRTSSIALHDDRCTGDDVPRARDVADSLRTLDPSVEGFFLRREDGAPTAPLAHRYRLPDAAFAISESDRRMQMVETPSFVVVRSAAIGFREIGQIMAGDGDLLERFAATDDRPRFFLRTLLPFLVEGAEPWLVGIWLELEFAEYERVQAAWNEAAYPSLVTEGRLANELTDIDFSAPVGTWMKAAVREVNAPPFVVGTEDPTLAERITKPWPAEAFNRFAVEHALL